MRDGKVVLGLTLGISAAAPGCGAPDDIRMICEGIAGIGLPGVTIQFVTP